MVYYKYQAHGENSIPIRLASTTGSDLLLLLGRSHELDLLLRSLEAAMTELGGSVDELELDLLLRIARGLHEQRLAQGDDALLNAGAAALDHHVVLGTVEVTLLPSTSDGARHTGRMPGTDTID